MDETLLFCKDLSTLCVLIFNPNLQTQTDSSSDPEEHKKLQATLTTERQNTKDMILVLMEDRRKMASLYMEEKKRSDDLNQDKIVTFPSLSTILHLSKMSKKI